MTADPIIERVAQAPDVEDGGAIRVLRTGLMASPELRVGLAVTVSMACVMAAGRLAVPVLIQQIIDRGLEGPNGFRPTFVYLSSLAAGGVVALVWVASRATMLRLVRTAESTLFALRVRTFEHLHRLSLADHRARAKGALVTRVTSDIDTLARFTEWGGVAWIVDTVLILGTFAVMAVYSWQLALLVIAVFLPLLPIFRFLQVRQLRAYDNLRTRVAESSTQISEHVTGAAVVRAYGLQDRGRTRMHEAVDNVYRARLSAARYFAFISPLSDLFGALALSVVVGFGSWWGPGWGLDLGELVAFLFLVTLLQSPISELSEILDQTQTALAGWRKVLSVMQIPIEVVEPDPGVGLEPGPLPVDVQELGYSYPGGPPVLSGVNVEIESGIAVAVVGATGSGKSTFASLLCRFADPTSGQILVGGVPLPEVSPESRRRAVRMVPQDGFLFDTTVRENVRFGRPTATDEEIEAAFEALDMTDWVNRLPEGISTEVGARGGRLSVGERQLVALARAQLADPSVLILDEATSAVDPETERELSRALKRLAAGRTTITIAHRLSTAEGADLVLVFDAGRLVEHGPHTELVTGAGIYAGLHESWLGITRT